MTLADLASPRYEALDAERCEFRPDRPRGERMVAELFVWHPDNAQHYGIAATGHAGLAAAMRHTL